MDEFFLHYLWKFQKFDRRPFLLTDGSQLQVFNPGYQNDDSGPDFLEAKLRIDDIDWVGAVEIHHKASDWIHHNHHKDKRYEGVVLHVVWIADKDITLSDGTPLPTFQMADFQNGSLESDYRKYINQPVTIKCASFLHKINPLIITSMLDQALVERLSAKANRIIKVLKESKGDWESATFQLIAQNFGFAVNNQAFDTWSRSFDYDLLQRYANQPDKCYALTFGLAGFLANPLDDYSSQLKKEYDHLKTKHKFDSVVERHHWKFSRLRPANFPTVRLAELTAIYIKQKNLFSTILGSMTIEQIRRLFDITLPEYWQSHYDFGSPMKNRTNNLGKSSIDILIINVVAPLLAAYSRYIDDQNYMDRAIDFLNQIPAESNKLTKEWVNLSLDPKHAADSQALIQRHKFYCQKSRCLNCNIGIAILHSRQ
ncbi:MAG: DUF2851 family protein [Bacteroidota bacterium]